MVKILVVDDEKHILNLCAQELGEVGYEVVTTNTGRDLLELIGKEKPDLVVLDIRLEKGERSGLEILQDIRQEFYNLPVILWTAYEQPREDPKAIAADYYVVKSYDLTELRKAIAQALETKGWAS